MVVYINDLDKPAAGDWVGVYELAQKSAPTFENVGVEMNRCFGASTTLRIYLSTLYYL